MTLAPHSGRILVVDDESAVRTMICKILRTAGFDVVEAESAEAGMTKLETTRFALVLIDIFMPNMDGTKAIKLLRERFPNLPIIAMSGVRLTATGRTALDLFPTSPQLSSIVCLEKPFRARQLLDAILLALSRAHSASDSNTALADGSSRTS